MQLTGPSLLLAAFAVSQFAAALSSDQQILGNTNDGLAHVHRKLVESEIIPTVIDDFKPYLTLTAEWKSDSAKLGNTLKPSNLGSAPSLHLEKARSKPDFLRPATKSRTIVIALTDPDAPSRDNPEWSEFCHWIAAGPSSSSTQGTHFHLEDIVEYKPPGPPPKTGKHRYVLLAFVAANGTTDSLHLTKPAERKHWGSDEEGHGVRDWAKDHGLIPIAANFIYAENEEQ
ncbi:hypothetical protein G7046_g7634 [Stylonectria norvegica]|nr:hypothetical protein G7046_g7634 [Stylonectria norvegica]